MEVVAGNEDEKKTKEEKIACWEREKGFPDFITQITCYPDSFFYKK